MCCRCACVLSVYVWWGANETRSRGEKGMAKANATSLIDCRKENFFALCQPCTPMTLSPFEILAVALRDLRSASRRVSWGAGFPPFGSARRELLESVEKKFRSIWRLLTGFFFGSPKWRPVPACAVRVRVVVVRVLCNVGTAEPYVGSAPCGARRVSSVRRSARPRPPAGG